MRTAGILSHRTGKINCYDRLSPRTSPVFTARARSLASLRAEHGWTTVDLLKISAEGAEFAILDAALEERDPVAAICVAFAQPADMRRVDTAFEHLAAGYVAVARTARPFNWKITNASSPDLSRGARGASGGTVALIDEVVHDHKWARTEQGDL